MPLPVPTLHCPVCSVSHTPVNGQLKTGVYAGSCQNCGYFFKFRAVQDSADTVTFTVNGTSYTVGNEVDHGTSLNEWLRGKAISLGTKQMCKEGGCGVCMVTVKLLEPVSGQQQVYAVNSCLVQVFMCDGWEVTTIEGLGNPESGLHLIQQRMVQYNASQCGYCTPGQVMNMYGLLQRKPSPTKQEIEDSSDAIICRCTGYRPILDAMKSFASDAPRTQKSGPIDIEDLSPKLCKTSGKPCRGKCGSGQQRPADQTQRKDQRAGGLPLHIVGAGAQWFKPTTLPALYALLKQHQADNYRLVFGNTGWGIFKQMGAWMYDVLIDIRGIKELYGISVTAPAVVLGANLSIGNLLDLFEREASTPATAYFADFAEHTKQVASNSIRSLACWAGNLMLKNQNAFFPSDIFTMFETVKAQLFIVDGDGNEVKVSLPNFLTQDMKGKVITAVSLPTYPSGDVYIKTYRVAKRLQLSYGYVLAGFNFQLDKNNNFLVKAAPSMVFQGISSSMIHATKTEAYLTGKQLGDPKVLQAAMTQLAEEIVPVTDPGLASPLYRHNLACALFYKFVLSVCSSKASQRYLSGGTGLYRPVSSASQDYGTTKQDWPLSQPMTKLDAAYQVSGETRYLEDRPLLQTELYAALVLTSQGNAKIGSLDPAAALALPGVRKFIQASDIPTGGHNSFYPPSAPPPARPEELLCSGQVLYAGQPVAIIVADDPETAETAASMVTVNYTDIQKPVTDLKEAIQQKMFYPDQPKPIVIGNPDDAMAKSAHRITGTLQMGTQAHFHMELQAARCAPNDDGGMDVVCTTQWIDRTCEVISNILNIPQSSVTCEVKRLGGAFGGKITRNFMVSGACALAAHVMRGPVRLKMDIHTNMKAVGKRYPYYCEYEVGFTNEGKLNGIIFTMYGDSGASANDSSVGYLMGFVDNAYLCPNWKYTGVSVQTHKAANTACRSPGSVPAMFLMETMIEHVAKSLNKDPSDVRKINFYQKGQLTPFGHRLDYCNLAPLVAQLETLSDLANRKNQVALFNQANRWKKRGLSLVPTKFPIVWGAGNFNVFVTIYHADGTIAVEHAGIEVGQGINTKTAQVCAYELGVPLSQVRVKKVSSVCNSNSTTTGGSVTSELNALGVVECCKILKSRMEPVRRHMDNPSWKELVEQCFKEGVDLSAHFFTNQKTQHGANYFVYAAAVTEVEVDILTGESQVLRTDMLYDCGESMNPELDIGQLEGGFVMGLGYHLMEKEEFDPTTGELITNGTWEYKPPLPKNLPIDFRVTLLKDAPSPQGILRSKAAGEPPLILSSSALFAIKYATENARADAGQTDYFVFNSPALAENIQGCCVVKPSDFTFGQ